MQVNRLADKRQLAPFPLNALLLLVLVLVPVLQKGKEVSFCVSIMET